MDAPTVTIVVPTWQRLRYLQEALSSALAQTWGDFELLVSDDGASTEIARHVASLGDPRIRYRSNPRILGIAMNNRVAFAEARGRYIASLHDDDVWEPDFLATLVPPLEADPQISVAFCDHHLIDEKSELVPRRVEINSRFFHRDRLKPGRHQPFLEPAVIDVCIPMVMAAVFRRSILDGTEYPPRIGGSYDHWLAYLAVRNGQACYYVPRRLTRYRIHSRSGSATRGVRNLLDSIYVRRKFLKDDRLALWHSRMRNDLGIFYGKIALHYLSARSSRRGRILLRHAFSLINRPKNALALGINACLTLLRLQQR